ncbi:hypothetical protein DFH07DRAFT_856829 [Mycena maculata]|uniref:Uncharacterized protein n=1 Tax=Mycena maculata TaxID=230809 RepID=A0AAD7MM85_9AGAR|nr:hypothetical protein DFH07DRAFT_856829 [Mycena maculata]
MWVIQSVLSVHVLLNVVIPYTLFKLIFYSVTNETVENDPIALTKPKKRRCLPPVTPLNCRFGTHIVGFEVKRVILELVWGYNRT